MGELIVLWKSPEELWKDKRALHAEHVADLARTYRQDDLVRAVFEGDSDALAKASASEIAVAKSEAARIEPEYFGCWSLYTARRLVECMKRDRDRQEEHERLVRRSERFLRRIGAIQ